MVFTTRQEKASKINATNTKLNIKLLLGMPYTMFNIRLFVNNILSVQTHNIRNIFFLQLVNKTAAYFSNFVFFFFLVAKIILKKVGEKMENNSTLEQVLLVFNRSNDLLRWLVGETFDYKVASLRRIRKKKLIILKSFEKKSLPYFVLFVCCC